MVVDAYLQSVVQLNFIPCEVVFFSILFMIFNNPFEHDLVQRFLTPTILLLFLIIVDNLDYWFYDNGDTSLAHVIVALLGYNIRILILISLILLSIRKNRSKYKWLLGIPEAFNLVISLLALNTHLVFWYEGRDIKRGIFAYVPHIVFALYIIIFAFIAVRKYRRGKHSESIFLSFAIFISALAVGAEMIFQLRGILMGAIALDIFCYYLYFHIEHYKFDPLTDLFNRDTFNARVNKGNIYAVFSIDMNNLKDLNDNLGHHYGDLALIATGRAILSSLPSNCYVYRVGGDEFTVLALSAISNLEDISKKIQYNVLEAGCTVAVGYAIVSDYDSFEDAYLASDKAMYKEKESMKKHQGTFKYVVGKLSGR